MFWTILALLLMVVLSGFISYYGDLQGRRWGKRRVSWFGLRPKYTAVIITSLTGAFIALMSIITVLIASPTVREVVLNGERLIRDNRRTLEENKRLNTSLAVERKVTTRELERLRTSTSKLQDELKLRQEKLKTSQLDLTLARRDVTEARQKLTPVQAEVKHLGQFQATLEATLKQEQNAIRQKSSELQTKIAENKTAAETNTSLIEQLQDKKQRLTRTANANRDLEEGNKKLQQEKDSLTRTVTNLSQKQMSMTHQNDVLLEVNKRLVSQNNEQEAANRTGKIELESIQRAKNSATEQLAKTRTELDQAVADIAGTRQTFTQSYHALRQGEINLRAGAELARRVVAGKQSSEAIRKQLVQLLEAASDTASVYGAKRGDNNRAVRIISKKLVSQFETQDADESASLNALSEVIAGSSTPVLVVATSLNNSLRGEQAVIELRQFPVRHVFDREAVVASRVIDANQSPQRVKEAIAEFLQQNVKNAAVRAGSIPHVNPETGRKEIGVYDSIALGQLAERVKRMGGNVLLKAVASEAITSADPLDDEHLRFETVRAPQG